MNEELEIILNSKASFQKTVFAPLSHEVRIKDILRGIKDKRLEKIIHRLRTHLDENNIKLYNQEKKFLPGVTFSATFKEKRRRENIGEYNEIIVLDIDKLNQEQMSKYKEILHKDKYVFSFWESPSKKGLKGLIKLSFEYKYDDIDISHRTAFKKLVTYFNQNYEIELDESGSDTTRLCFLSSDENLVLKDKIAPFVIIVDDIIIENTFDTENKRVDSLKKGKSVKTVNKKDALYNPKGKNIPSNRLAIKSIIKFLSKRNLSITNSYEKWYRVAFAIATSFTYDIGEKYFLSLCRLDKEKHNEIESKNLLISCYEKTDFKISFNTIYHYAQENGYKSKNIVRDGNEGV
jgi:hypothetical protein